MNSWVIIIFVLLLGIIIWSSVNWKRRNDLIRSQKKELMMYQLYIKPLEELVKGIRVRQHEFDNHLNAILNMHFTIDNYAELVKCQSEYIGAISRSEENRLLPLLRISDKVLAGFLYSKIKGVNDRVEIQVEVRSREIISGVSEHSLIEIVGVLVDNAIEACEEGGTIQIVLDSAEDHLIFQIANTYKKLSYEEISRFFEPGYTTKQKSKRKRGLGLVRVKQLVEKYHGEITVGQEASGTDNYIQFTVKI